MNKLMLLAAGIAASIAFAGCALPGSPAIPTPQQLVTDFCPTVNADLKLLAVSPLLNASQQQLLNGVPGDATRPGIIAINNAVCAAGGQINVTDLQTLNNTAFPALIGLVGALPMLPNQPAILLGLTLAQPILNQIVAQVMPAAPASSVVPTSAPSAASTPQ
ncbi:hypothetical protein PQR12_31055 [Paraburkholderia nemoris]|uniref:hypothetical protein n=1 Tax=Paraburkholderia nemoris TaxID=2793076 RepID=UPI0038BAE928